MFRVMLTAISVCSVWGNEGFLNIELSPVSVASVPFDGGHIAVWEHAKTPGRYYAMPPVDLLHDSARIINNILTGQFELLFDILVWSVEAKEDVYIHVKSSLNASAAISDVEMIPMEKVRIVWRDGNRPISKRYQLAGSWRANTHLPSRITFQFTCADHERCNKLKHGMKALPGMFNALELEYVINGQRSASRVMTVTGENIVRGNLYSRLSNMPNATPDGDRYLTSDDLKLLTSEAVRDVVASVVTDSDYVDNDDKVSMEQVLLRELQGQEISASSFKEQMWNSVFWNSDWARPDKMTHYLNKVLSKDASDSRNFILDEDQRSESSEGGGGLKTSFLGFTLGGGGGRRGTSSSRTKLQKETVLAKLKERHKHVEFDGEKFRVKPMKMYRLNLSTLKSSTKVGTSNIQVRRYETVHSVKIRVAKSTSRQTPSVTPDLVEARLMAKIRQLNETNRQLSERLDETNRHCSGLSVRLNQTNRNLETQTGGAMYVRWGRTTCPGGADLVYAGYSAGGHYRNTGAGSDLVCLSPQPEWLRATSALNHDQTFIHGAEYQQTKSYFSYRNAPTNRYNALQDHDVPCAVCRSQQKSHQVMIPGRKTCHGGGWNREYWGFLMTAKYDSKNKVNHVCVDEAPEARPGGAGNGGDARLYVVQAGSCSTLPCSVYPAGKELLCVVCTK